MPTCTRLVYFLFFLFSFASAAVSDEFRIVPQLEATAFEPTFVQYNPIQPDILLVLNDFGRIDILDISNLERPLKRAEINTAARAAAFSPDGQRIVSGGNDGTVRLWQLDGTPVGTPFEGHGSRVSSVAFSPDGQRIVSGGGDGTVRLWQLDGTPVGTPFEGHGDWVSSVAFSPDGQRIVSGGEDGTVRLWQLDGTPVGTPFEGHGDWVSSVAFSPDGQRIVSGGEDGTVRLWQLDGTPVGTPFEGHGDWVWSVAFSPDGQRIVSGGGDGTVRLWQLDGTPVGTPFEGHGDVVLSVAFSPDGQRIVSGGDDGTVRLWQLDGTPVGTPFEGHLNWVSSVAFSPDGQRIVSGGEDGTVRLWQLDGTPVGTPFEGHGDVVWSVAFSPDGQRIVSGGDDGTVRLWQLDGTPVGTPFEGHLNWVSSVAFSPDGQRIVSGGGDGTVRLWQLDGTPVGTPFEGHLNWVSSVAFSPDGQRIVSGGDDGTVRLWQLDGTPVGTPFEGHGDVVWSVAFSPDGQRIVSGGDDGTVRLWQLDGTPVGTPFEGHGSRVSSVAFSPDGQRIVSGGNDGTVRLWQLDGTPVGTPFEGCRATKLAFLTRDRFATFCPDRVEVFDTRLTRLGTVHFGDGAGATLVLGEGAHFSGDDARSLLRTLTSVEGRTAVLDETPTVSEERVLQVLLNEWTAFERALFTVKSAAQQAQAFYQRQNAWLKLSFWPVLLWSLVLLSAFLCWVFAPAWLCKRFLPRAYETEPPPWTWLIEVLTTFGWVSRTGRPVKAWFRKHRSSLEKVCFLDRTPVTERQRYAEVALIGEMALPTGVRSRRERLIAWVYGKGGSGKSSYTFSFARNYLVGKLQQPMPVLVDEDWTGTLAQHVAGLLRLPEWDRYPTENMVRRLGAAGLLCPIVDSLSERNTAVAVDSVEEAIRDGHFRHLIVTSRTEPTGANVWNTASVLETKPISRNDVPKFLEKYIDCQSLRGVVAQRIEKLVATDPVPSPLFLRFAIEQASVSELGSTTQIDLVLRYIEASRVDSVDVNGDDFLRAASHAALEAVRGERLVPRELEFEFLNGALVTVADKLPFFDVERSAEVSPSKIIDRLVSCGILNRNASNRRLQFAYDPVAEYLAAWRLNKAPDDAKTFRRLVNEAPQSSVAQALHEISNHREAALGPI